jgi:enoyl-CoA hydratase/carnithine racemase
MTAYRDIGVDRSGHIGIIEIRRPPNNFFDRDMISEIADAAEAFDTEDAVRVVLLCAQGRNFCAGADLANRPETGTTAEQAGGRKKHLYKEGIRLFRTKKPIVAAVQGAAIGGGLGLALSADFRVTCAEARFSANFTRMNFHPGFGLTATLPRLVGAQKAALLFYTGRRVPGDEAVAMGIADKLVPMDTLREAAMDFANDIAQSGPLAIMATRETLRRGLDQAVEAATERELVEQDWLRGTADFKEGVKAMNDRRPADFKGR